MKKYTLILVSLFALCSSSHAALNEYITDSNDYDFSCYNKKLIVAHEKLDTKVYIEQASEGACQKLKISLRQEQANSLSINLTASSNIISKKIEYRDNSYYPNGLAACRSNVGYRREVEVCKEKLEYALYKMEYEITIDGFSTGRLETNFSKRKENFVRKHGPTCSWQRCN